MGVGTWSPCILELSLAAVGGSGMGGDGGFRTWSGDYCNEPSRVGSNIGQEERKFRERTAKGRAQLNMEEVC